MGSSVSVVVPVVMVGILCVLVGVGFGFRLWRGYLRPKRARAAAIPPDDVLEDHEWNNLENGWRSTTRDEGPGKVPKPTAAMIR